MFIRYEKGLLNTKYLVDIKIESLHCGFEDPYEFGLFAHCLNGSTICLGKFIKETEAEKELERFQDSLLKSKDNLDFTCKTSLFEEE